MHGHDDDNFTPPPPRVDNPYGEGRLDELGRSRSERRREALDVLAVAHRLMDLEQSELDALAMDDDLRELIETSRRVKQQIARKRQTQFLAKHLRRDEAATLAIRESIDHARDADRRANAKLLRVEHWRDRLVAGDDDTLGEFLAEAPEGDRQQLRTLIRRAQQERDLDKPPAAARELYRVLRELIVAG
jgi:ribosome-associated protein